MIGSESTLYRVAESGEVVKIYGDVYHDLNRRFDRTLEQEWYRRRPIAAMPQALIVTDTYIVLPYCGRPVQAGGGVIDVPDLARFTVFLDELETQLIAAGVNQGDLHGENILVDEAGDFWVIDWSWASYGVNPKRVADEPLFGDDAKMFAEWRRCLVPEV